MSRDVYLFICWITILSPFPDLNRPALVDLLPEIACVSDDPYNSSPEEESSTLGSKSREVSGGALGSKVYMDIALEEELLLECCCC